MTELAYSFHSPLTLLEQWRGRSDGARLREFLVTGYTLDLAFLERFAVATARALGARITVLADGGQAVHDPVDVRGAGRVYQHGHAHCRGAFHPKLVVLLGDEQVWLAIGSGNPTASGWGHNQELWLTVRAELVSGPRLLADVARWLEHLPEFVAMPSWIASTLTEIASHLSATQADGTWPDVRVLGNLRQPIVDQLPTGPVEELNLVAPFVGPGANAVRALVMRFRPGLVRVALQPTWTYFDGPTLVAATAGAAQREFRLIPDNAPVHGKLVEWRTAGDVFTTLTGSANLTGAALLESVADGGNCELAVIAPSLESLLPPGTEQDASSIAKQSRERSSARVDPSGPPGFALLGCALDRDALLVELAAPMTERVTIETSPSGAPGTWRLVGELPAGTTRGRLVLPERAGDVVRAVIDRDGERFESQPVFVTNPVRCRPRRDAADEPRLARVYAPEEIFTDPAVAARFTDDLNRLVGETRSRPGGTPTARVRQGAVDATAATDRWADYLDACDRALGPSLSRLVFPQSAILTSARQDIPEWTIDDVSSDEMAGETSEPDEVDAEPAAVTAPTVPVVRGDERRRYRAWASRWVEAVATEQELLPDEAPDAPLLPSLPVRMLVARLYLTLLAAGVWQSEGGWRQDLRWLVWALTPYERECEETPEEGLDHLHALQAVCMALLLRDTQLHGGREDDIVSRDAWEDAQPYIARAKLSLAEDLLLPATAAHAQVPTPDEVRRTIDLAVEAEGDPHAEARAELEASGTTVTTNSGVWLVTTDRRNVRLLVGRAATMLADQKGAAVVAANHRHAVLLMWAGYSFAYIDRDVRVWRLGTLSAGATPLSVCKASSETPPGRPAGQRGATPREVHEIAKELRVDLAAALRLLASRDN